MMWPLQLMRWLVSRIFSVCLCFVGVGKQKERTLALHTVSTLECLILKDAVLQKSNLIDELLEFLRRLERLNLQISSFTFA